MNEQPCSLTEIIKAREATIEKLKASLAESEEQYVALQESNNEKWTKINGLEAEIRSLENTKLRLTDESKYWKESYKEVVTRAEIQEATYLKVIKALSDRD